MKPTSFPRHVRRVILALLAACSYLGSQARQQPFLLDDCEDVGRWTTFQSAGVLVSHRLDAGTSGGALRFDVEFTKGSGYGGVFRSFNRPLPQNHEITFMMRSTVPVNNFEVKVSNDSLGENIWWVNNKNYTYPTQWKRIVIKKRHLGFAWGPKPSATPDVLRRIELVVTAGSGGSGSVWIDNIELHPIPQPPAKIPKPSATASSVDRQSNIPANVFQGGKKEWVSKTSGREWIEVDYGYQREIGGLKLVWDRTMKNLQYDVLVSTDGVHYDTAYHVRGGKGGPTLTFIPETEARYLRLSLPGNETGKPYRLRELVSVPSESLSTNNQYFERLAADAPPGYYPRYFVRQKSYWTIAGVPSDEKEALLNEDGMIEVDKQRFSIEPFVRMNKDGNLLTWSNARLEQSLESGYLPIPSITRVYDNLSLRVTLLAVGEAGKSALMARYVLRNTSTTQQQGTLFLALRPFQVNPSYQWLNFDGGFARTDTIAMADDHAIVGDKTVLMSGRPDARGATPIDGGEIIEHIARGVLPASRNAVDPTGMASAAYQYGFDLAQGDSMIVVIAVPFTSKGNRWNTTRPTKQEFEDLLAQLRSKWEQMLNTVGFKVPLEAQKYIDILRSNLGYVLINKDGNGFQPGSRSYERSWIRDGSMTSAALLKLGLPDEVKRYVDWYASYQYENGMIPCVVDKRGPDPVPEHDSHGELIFACMEYFRFTGDTAFLRTRWPNIVGAVNYLQSLRAQRMTPEYRQGNDEKRAFYGLVTESISHEGYSAKAMHSYWDNFFVLKGFKDAAAAARAIGKTTIADSYDSLASAFRVDLYSSMALAMKNRKIDYVPGCVELGDFDPTSTSISLFPCGELNHVPEPAFHRTYDKYFEWFEQRADGKFNWDAYTPYEIRTVGTYVYMGQKERAHYLLEWFLKYQRPQAWNHWAEVVWHDERLPRFIGDMPHTWVGSDYINAIRAMFAYELEEESSLVVGAGLKDSWVQHGLSVNDLPTHFGSLSYSISTSQASVVSLQLIGPAFARGTQMLVPVSLLQRKLVSASIDGSPVTPSNGFVRISRLPATVTLTY